MRPFHTLFAEFNLKLDYSEIGFFRKGMSAVFGEKFPLIFNEQQEKYPLIQFRVWKKNAALFGLNEGADQLYELIDLLPAPLRVGNRSATLKFNHSVPEKNLLLQTGEKKFCYRIFSWMPFNSKNLETYKQAEDMHERLTLMQQILKNHLVAFAREVKAIDAEHKLFFDVRILDITGVDRKRIKSRYIDAITPDLENFDFDRVLTATDTAMRCYDLVFEVNAQLPGHIGLGRNTSHGFGWIISEEANTEENQ